MGNFLNGLKENSTNCVRFDDLAPIAIINYQLRETSRPKSLDF